MKKLLAMLLALCMMAMLAPALADGEGESGLGALLGLVGSLAGGEESGEDAEGADMSALLGLVGSLAGGEESGETKGADMSGLLGLVGGLLGGANGDGENAEPAYTAVAAESIDQFYGVWEFSKASANGMEITPAMLALLGTSGSARMTIGDNQIDVEGTLGDLEKSYHVDSTEASKYPISMELVDGALSVTLDGEAVVLSLSDAGELVCDLEGLGTAFFTRVE